MQEKNPLVYALFEGNILNVIAKKPILARLYKIMHNP